MLQHKIGRKPTHDQVLSYFMYPDVFLKFSRARDQYDGVEVLPTPQFYYGMERGSDISVELEPGKTLVIKFLTVGEAHPDGTRTVFFELNGQPREVTVRDRKLEAKVETKPKADPKIAGQIGAPIPGIVSTVAVEPQQVVAKGDRLLVMEAMKMQSTVYAPVGGKVTQLLVRPGQNVEAKDLLLVIE
jgi:pyruvate carboxylase